MLATIGIFNIVGATASGWLTDRRDPRWLLFWYYGLRGLALLGLNSALSDAGLVLVVFVVFYGLDWVATVPPTVALCREAFGTERAGVVFAWVFAPTRSARPFAAWGAGLSRGCVRLVPAGLPVRRLARHRRRRHLAARRPAHRLARAIPRPLGARPCPIRSASERSAGRSTPTTPGCATPGCAPRRPASTRIFNWDHFFPLFGDPDGPSFECWTTLGVDGRGDGAGRRSARS